MENRYKVVRIESKPAELYDLLADPMEQHDIAAEHPERVSRMVSEMEEWQRSVERSLTGADY